jgi:uncharacterized repeat protein (TIGR02543 family)
VGSSDVTIFAALPKTYDSTDDDVLISAPSDLPGYTFAGWHVLTKPDGGTNTDFDTDNDEYHFDPSDGTATGNVVLEAKWDRVEYDIAVNLNDAARVGTASETGGARNGTQYTIESPEFTFQTPTLTAYTFDGWLITVDPTPSLALQAGNQTVVVPTGTYGDITVTVDDWTPIPYVLIYNLVGGSNDAANPATYTIEDTLNIVGATKPGYGFYSWTVAWSDPQTNGDHGPSRPNDGTSPTIFDAVGGWLEILDGPGIYGDLTLTAHWSSDVYFSANGGVFADGTTLKHFFFVDTHVLGDAYPPDGRFPVPQRDYYYFDGWFTTANGGARVYPTTPVSGNKTYFANWTKIVIPGPGPTPNPDYDGRDLSDILAGSLNKLGLFRGVGDVNGVPNYALGQTPTRLEGLILTLRFLGLEDRAYAYTGTNPFTDVGTANSYDRLAAYAFNVGLANGVNPERTLFNPNAPIGETEVLVLLLRSLGYSDTKGDFIWNSAAIDSFATIAGGFSPFGSGVSDYTAAFARDDLVVLMANFLLSNVKGTNIKLIDQLVADGVITNTAAVSAFKVFALNYK